MGKSPGGSDLGGPGAFEWIRDRPSFRSWLGPGLRDHAERHGPTLGSAARCTLELMSGWAWLILAAIAGLLVMFLFAFTLPGLLGEAVAALAVLALLIKGVLAIVGPGRASRYR